jgi:hypothetical protein
MAEQKLLSSDFRSLILFFPPLSFSLAGTSSILRLYVAQRNQGIEEGLFYESLREERGRAMLARL